LTHGVRHLRPLNLRTIADAISMHESTVSRVTRTNTSPPARLVRVNTSSPRYPVDERRRIAFAEAVRDRIVR